MKAVPGTRRLVLAAEFLGGDTGGQGQYRCCGGPCCPSHRLGTKPKLHALLPAADLRVGRGKHFSFNDRRNFTFLAERADSADPVRCLMVHIGWSHHLRSLAPKRSRDLFHADLAIRGDEHANRPAIHL